MLPSPGSVGYLQWRNKYSFGEWNDIPINTTENLGYIIEWGMPSLLLPLF